MKARILFGAMCILSLCSCESIGGIHGTWKHTEDTGHGTMSSKITFKSNGRYSSTFKNNTIDDSWSSVSSSGDYMYIGENEGVLYMYNREEGGYIFGDTAKYNVRIEGRTMYMITNGVVTEYHKGL